MNFHAELHPKPLPDKIYHHHKILLIGSCFTRQIGSKLAGFKFNTLENPNGILFNPASISHSLTSYAAGTQYEETDLFYHNELWNSWQHHSMFSGSDKAQTLQSVNSSQQVAHDFLNAADWILITLGSAFVYENPEDNNRIVANCHKVPADRFYRRLLDVTETRNYLISMIETVRAGNPSAKFIFTISPVRHLREGFIDNNRSKAVLIQAVHSLMDFPDVYYFPSYELIIDDLRDYRFYAEDLVHPNHAATNYVWEKFVAACVDESSKQLMKEIGVIVAARNHKPFNPDSEAHQRFCQTNLQKILDIKSRHEYLDLKEEIDFFSRN